jgi:putative ABC transport system permease protein
MTSRRAFRLRALAARVRGFLRGPQDDGEFDDEIHEHLLRLTERFVAQGMPREAAAAAARRQFGNTTLLHEDRRALQTLPAVDAWWHDLRYVVRTLWGSPGFAIVSITTLALGIGAATAIFSVIDNVLLEPFPEKGAARMVFARIHSAQQSQDQGRQGYTSTEILEFAENNHVFDGFAAATGESVLYKHGEGTEHLAGARVTPGTFEFFGMPALHGRVMQASDYEPQAPAVFVMRYKAWMERFGGDLSILNRTLLLNGTPRTLVGIMTPRFGWYGADVYIPQTLTRDTKGPADALPRWFLLGRLKPGVSVEQAEADLTVIANRLAKIYPHQYPARFTVHVRKRVDAVVGRFEATLYTVLAAVGLLLLIACSNVANLMLARATTREKEFALRAALGAGRARLVRLLMLEGLVLAMAGAALGTVTAWGGLKLVVAAMPQNLIPSQSVIELNAFVLAFALGVAVLTPLVFGLAPALQSSRPDLNDSLRDSGKGVGSGFQGRWLRDVVVVVEVALSLTLLIGAGLLMRSFAALREVHLGLQPDHVFQTVLVLPADRYKTAEQVTAVLQPLLARLKALPGVLHAAVTTAVPPYSNGESILEIAGKIREEQWRTFFQQVSEEYFDVLRLEFRQGRPFSDVDVRDARRVAVVNETFVRTYLPDDNPLGRRLRLASLEPASDLVHDAWFEIVGVVGDVTNRGLQVPSEPEVWIPSTITGSSAHALIVRTSQEPETMMNTIRREVWATDPRLGLAYASTLEDWISERLYAGPRFGSLLMTIFACVGLLLVTVGVYSVLAYSTTQKTHEIGVRMALGARGGDVLGMIVRSGLRLVMVGIALGIGMSLALGRMIGTQLVGVTTYDPPALAGATMLLTMTAAIACWIPAWRAARIDPLAALRCE